MTMTGPWRESSRSGANQDDNRVRGEFVRVSDSKPAHGRPILTVAPAGYNALPAWVEDNG